tara:strand:+ start:3693 stop:4403 length:711 start_codon:yes stop_codon:yes gene_type:complete
VNSLYDFIVEPAGERYNNTKQLGGRELIVNTKIEEYKAVNKTARVIALPKAFTTEIKVGDIIAVHQNVFRRFYNMKGKEQNSRSYFKENMYFCSLDQVYFYKRNGQWKSVYDRCLVKPIKSLSNYVNRQAEPQTGVVKVVNKKLLELNIAVGDLVSFPPQAAWEFILDSELFYCMKSSNITLKHEYKGDEEEYNPSWGDGGQRVDKSSEGTDCRYRGGCNCGPTQERSCHQEVSNF